MKMTTNAKVRVLAVEKKEATRDYAESYKIAIMQGSEVGTLSCTKDVYEALASAEMYKEYNVAVAIGDYQGKITLRITSVSADPVKSGGAPTSAPAK